jgi:hypothetical protein
MTAHPGKKLLFMGTEFGQWQEWRDEHSLDWHLLESPTHRALLDLNRDLNAIYRDYRAATRATRIRRVSAGSTCRMRDRSSLRVPAPGAERCGRSRRSVRVQLHAGAA